MATTIDLPCPKCGKTVYGEYRKGWFHDLMFFQLMRTSFILDCPCGFRKSYWFISAKNLEKMYQEANEGDA